MGHVFNDLEGLRIAIEMERRGEAFYRRAARISKNADTVALLNALAGDEQVHAARFQTLYDEECARNAEACKETYDPEISAYLSAVAADIIFPGGLMALRQSGFESPAGVIAEAIASEKDSILFYTQLADCARDGHTRDIFLEIVRQEREHMTRLQKLWNDSAHM